MNTTKRVILEAGESAIERAKSMSQQPRFNQTSDAIFSVLSGWLKRARELQEPIYKSDSRKRDKWLREFAYLEPHWGGVLTQTVMIDSNRGWMLIGGRNQVNRYTTVLHNAEDGKGWRIFAKKCSAAFRVTDMCSVVETARQGKNGPLRAIYNVDSARCKLTGDSKFPLNYYPPNGNLQKWRKQDFFRVVAMPSTDERFNDLGFCATSQALELVKLMHGVLTHDQEQVGARMPEGLMIINGLDQSNWDDMLRAREHQLDADMRRYFGGIFVLATSGADQVNAQLVGLSSLPAGFDRETFIDQTMYGYSLIVGYQPNEFWPITGSVLGRGKEEEQAAMRATTKGGMDWALSFTEQMQGELPDSLHFEFEQRDEHGELIQAQVSQAWAEVTDTLRQPQGEFEPGTITRSEARQMLAQHGIIPSEWTETEEKEVSTDTEDSEVRSLWLDNPNVRRSCERFPQEPIVMYKWNGIQGREVVLWDSGNDALRPRVWRVIKRQTEDDSEVVYESPDGEVVITENDVARAITDGERRVGEQFAEMLTADELPEDEEDAA